MEINTHEQFATLLKERRELTEEELDGMVSFRIAIQRETFRESAPDGLTPLAIAALRLKEREVIRWFRSRSA